MASNGDVRGMKEATAAFKAMPDIMREALLDNATAPTVSEIVRAARARLQSSPSIRTRALYNHLESQINRKTGRGRVGVSHGSTVIATASGKKVRVKGLITAGKGGGAAGGKKDDPARRAHFIEFGTQHAPAEPFMIPATESQEGPYLDRCRHAGKAAEKKIAAIGMRHL